MMIRTLMVNLDLGHSNSRLLTLTGDLAERFDAGVVGIAACQLTQSPYSDGYVSGELVDLAQRDAEKNVQEAEAQFRLLIEKRLGCVDWRSRIVFDEPAHFVARQARCADVIIIGALPPARLGVEIGDLVMESGRPVLSVPPNIGKLAFEHVVVAWKDTREARRAVAAALPMLKIASHISVVEVVEPDDISGARERLEDVVHWLARHGADAKAIPVAAESDDKRAFNEFVQAQNADLVVAGAYGHSRMREWVLGGFTRSVLNAFGICSLVVH
jgi:nucleotide-binding universal stress UspA family protein